MTDIAQLIIHKIEAADLKTAGSLRNSVYLALASCGLDVDKLRRDALMLRLSKARVRKPHYEKLIAEIDTRVKTFSHVPTREMVAQRGEQPVVETFEMIDGRPQPLRSERHRWEWPVDKIRHTIPADHYHAAERFRWAYETSQGHARIGDYGDGAGRSDPARRLALTPEQEQAGRVWNVMNVNMNQAVRLIAWNFILELPPRGWDRPLTAVEFGKEYGHTTNESRARGVTDGALKTACSVLSDVNRGYQEWLRGRDRPQPLNENERKILEKWERRT